MSIINLEFFKLRHKRLFLMVTLLISVEIAWAFISVGMSISRNPGMVGWKDIIMTLASMNGLFLPIIAAVVVSRICDMEHKGNTWKLLLSACVKRSHIYAAKYICACLLLFYAGILQVLAIVLFGAANAFEQPLPFSLLMRFLGGTMVTNIVVISLQQWVSLAVKNQSFALCLGMIGAFIGMTADLFPSVVRSLFVWSYYTGLCPVTYSYTGHSTVFAIRTIETSVTAVIVFIGALVYVVGSIRVSRQEI